MDQLTENVYLMISKAVNVKKALQENIVIPANLVTLDSLIVHVSVLKNKNINGKNI